MSWTIEAVCGCNTGKIRRNNEDNFFVDGKCLNVENDGLKAPAYTEIPVKGGVMVAVFDGMGGENFGEIASYTAAQCMQQLQQEKKTLTDRISPSKYLSRAVLRLNDAIVCAKRELCTSRMGTTMVGVYFYNCSAYVVNIGDSRAYLMREGELRQLSEDHVEHWPDRGRKKAPLTQHLGVDPDEMTIEPFIVKTDLHKGDRYLLCSDGLTDMLSDDEIAYFMRTLEDIETCVNCLVQAALNRGGRDNITVIVCKAAK